MQTSTIIKPPFSVETTRFCTSGKVLEYDGTRTPFQLALFDSPISGQGLRVVFGKIPNRWPVIRYTGPILTNVQAAKYWQRLLQLSDNPRLELFTLDAQRSINGARSLAAFVNHSCAPNCRIYTDPDRDLVAFYAIREIFQDEELTIDYSLHVDGSAVMALHPCQCGAPDCRGFMDSPLTIAKYRQAEAGTVEPHGETTTRKRKNAR